MTPASHAIPTANGASLAATLFPASEARAVVLIHPATAVTQAFYAHFARYLAGIGLTALTYDYRGTGASRGPSLRGETVTMANWMLEDVPAVTRWAAERFPHLPLLAIGHSVGGHALLLSGEQQQVRAGVQRRAPRPEAGRAVRVRTDPRVDARADAPHPRGGRDPRTDADDAADRGGLRLGAGEDGQDDDEPGQQQQPLEAGHAAPTRPATICADSATSGRPPPGCEEPPTRNSPGTGERFEGRRKAAAAPLLEVP